MKLWHRHNLVGFLPFLLGLSLTTPVIASEVAPNTSPPTHLQLLEEPWSQDPIVQAALEADNGKLQLLSPDQPTYLDDISVIVDTMPQGLTPQTFLAEIVKDPNGTINYQPFDDYLSENGDTLNKLIRRNTSTPPQVGDIYDINLRLFAQLGVPDYEDDVSVMLTELAENYFVLSTITSGKTGQHPVNSSREFGFHENDNGKLTFYTRSVTQISNIFGDFGNVGGMDDSLAMLPEMGWTNFIEGIGTEIQTRGGQSDLNSLRVWTAAYANVPIATSVPEPASTLSILGFGASVSASLLLKHRRKKQKYSD